MGYMIITALLTLLTLSEASSSDLPKIMPNELVEFAEWNNCSQVSDFYERNTGPINPPYVYGYTSDKGEDSGDFYDSAVFWCQKNQPAKKQYVLMFKFKNSDHPLAKCPFQIESEGSPGGLSVSRDRITLQGFVFYSNTKKNAPANARMKHNAIRIDWGGVESLLYCYKGEWLVLARD